VAEVAHPGHDHRQALLAGRFSFLGQGRIDNFLNALF
jgi:hypothetical protein